MKARLGPIGKGRKTMTSAKTMQRYWRRLKAILLTQFSIWVAGLAMACGSIIGGSCGNILDRVQHQAVYDFLDFHAYGYHWPAFNVADCAVVIGIAIIAYDSLFLSAKSEEKTP